MKTITIDLKKVNKYLATDTFLFMLKQKYMASRTRDLRITNPRQEDEKIGTKLFWSIANDLSDSPNISKEEVGVIISLYFGCSSFPLLLFDYWERRSTSSVVFINRESSSMFKGSMPMINIKPNEKFKEKIGSPDLFFVSYNHDLFRLTASQKRFREVREILETKYYLSLECFQGQMQLWLD